MKWVTRPRTGKTLTKCHFFFKSEKLVQTDKSKNRHTFKSYYLILGGKFEPKKILTKKFNLGCAPYARSWVFFQNFQNIAFLLLYYSACKKATAKVFISSDRGYPAVRFEYKTVSERYLVAELWAKQFWVFFERIETLIFFENTQNCFAYISATNYR